MLIICTPKNRLFGSLLRRIELLERKLRVVSSREKLSTYIDMSPTAINYADSFRIADFNFNCSYLKVELSISTNKDSPLNVEIIKNDSTMFEIKKYD